MKRRDFLGAIGIAAALPRTARAQQSIPTIGFIGSGSPDFFRSRIRPFHESLAEQGYTDGRNISVEYRWAEGQNERLKPMALELVQRRVSVIVAVGEPTALAAKAATQSIPIAFIVGGDPVEAGLVASLQNPGGNATGVTLLNIGMASKRLQLLNELVPSAARIAALIDPTAPRFSVQAGQLEEAAGSLRIGVDAFHASTSREIEEAFRTIAQRRLGALVIGPSIRFNGLSVELGALSLRFSVPAIYQTREFVSAGGLAAYGGSGPEAYRSLAIYCARILKGEPPRSLPVQQAAKVEMFINMKTAKTLGISVPLPLLGRADEVIE
jgi:putative tryptophan/tyrosine transport system substrate-binding protein